MAGRPPKKGIDFSGWSVNVLEDPKVDILIDSQGIAAFTVYFYLCQKAYKANGYYLDWGYSQCATDARRLGKGASAEYVKNVVDMCFHCCLFEKRLFELYGILTSRGLQLGYMPVISERKYKSVIKEYWLLEHYESAGIDKVTLKSNYALDKLNYEGDKSNYAPIDSIADNSILNESIEKETIKPSSALIDFHYNKIINQNGGDISETMKRSAMFMAEYRAEFEPDYDYGDGL